MSDTLLDQLQADVAERLRGDDVLGQFTVVTERTNDPVAEVSRKLGLVQSDESKGLCLVVFQLTALPESNEVHGPLLTFRIIVRVLENPILNGSGITALAAARRAGLVLHHYSAGGLGSLLLAESPFISPVEDPLAPLAYDLAFSTHEAETSVPDRVARPSFTPDADAFPKDIQISCATSGVTIWYTIDGTYPRPGGATSQELTGSFATIAGPCRLRAVATKEDLIPSDAAFLDIT